MRWMARCSHVLVLLLIQFRVATPIAAPGVCWDGEFTADRCCDEKKGPGGDTSCWSEGYSFSTCCQVEAKPPSNTCWSDGFSANECCDQTKGQLGDFSCWGGEFNYKTCCLSHQPRVQQGLVDFRRWTGGDSVANIASVPTSKLRRCIWNLATSACEHQWYAYEMSVAAPQASVTFYGDICVPLDCPDAAVRFLLIPLDITRKHGARSFEGTESFVVLKARRPQTHVPWERLYGFVPLMLLGLLFMFWEPREAESAERCSARTRDAGLDWARTCGTVLVLLYHLQTLWTWAGDFLVPPLGPQADALFWAISASLLEERSCCLQGFKAFPSLLRQLLRKVVRAGIPCAFDSALALAAFAWYMPSISVFLDRTRIRHLRWANDCEASVQAYGVFTDTIGPLFSGASVREALNAHECVPHWFFSYEFRCWLGGALLLATPWGIGVPLGAAATMWLRQRPLEDEPEKWWNGEFVDFFGLYLVLVLQARLSRRALHCDRREAIQAAALFAASVSYLVVLPPTKFWCNSAGRNVVGLLALRLSQRLAPPCRLVACFADYSAMMLLAAMNTFSFLSFQEDSLVHPFGVDLARITASAFATLIVQAAVMRHLLQRPGLKLLGLLEGFVFRCGRAPFERGEKRE